MSDGPKIAIAENLNIEVPIRRVLDTEKGYVIAEFKNVSANLWVFISKYYVNSTNAYAALGKMYQRDMIKAVPEKYRQGPTDIPPEPNERWSGDKKLEKGNNINGVK